LLQIYVKGELINEELSFNNLVDVPSYPEEFLGFKCFIIPSSGLNRLSMG